MGYLLTKEHKQRQKGEKQHREQAKIKEAFIALKQGQDELDVCGIFTDREDSEPHQNGPKRGMYLGAPKPMSGS